MQKSQKKKEIGAITKLTNKLINSFDNKSDGFSARKLSAFIAVSVSVGITVYYVDTEVLPNVLWIWLLFALLCLGIITAEQVIRLKEGVGNNTEEKEEITHSVENTDSGTTQTTEIKKTVQKEVLKSDQDADPVI